ncbi:hypothetical protein HPX95_08485 [Bacillus tequilensis]|nr:hypothetical protein [Bacillus tequilensis]NTU26216.1 hypothetical protein [Bacillus tequilensis]
MKKLYVSFTSFIVLSMMLFTAFTFTPSAKAVSEITGNHSMSTAAYLGYWKYHPYSDPTKLKSGENVAYYKFTAQKDEKLYVQSTYRDIYEDMKIEVLDESGHQLYQNPGVTKGNYSSFIFAKADATKTSQTFYVRVTRGSYTGDMYFSLSFNNRIKSGSKTFTFSGTASNTGNRNYYNRTGQDSSVLTLDLRNEQNVPHEATVKRVTTSSNQYPRQGNTVHFLMTNQDSVWHKALANSSTSGIFDISLDKQYLVANKWNFKYNTLSSASSTMSRVGIKFDYEYDVTKQF